MAAQFMVPLVPTAAMIAAGRRVIETCPDAAEVWRRMVLASPTPAPEKPQGGLH